LLLAGDSAGAATVRAQLDALGAAPGAAFGRVIAGLPGDPPDALFAGLGTAAEESDPFLLMLPMRTTWYDRLRGDPRLGELAGRLGLPVSAIAALEPVGAGGGR
jgi:hypothetical protein